jgi:hypothetical protein
LQSRDSPHPLALLSRHLSEQLLEIAPQAREVELPMNSPIKLLVVEENRKFRRSHITRITESAFM